MSLRVILNLKNSATIMEIVVGGLESRILWVSRRQVRDYGQWSAQALINLLSLRLFHPQTVFVFVLTWPPGENVNVVFFGSPTHPHPVVSRQMSMKTITTITFCRTTQGKPFFIFVSCYRFYFQSDSAASQPQNVVWTTTTQHPGRSFHERVNPFICWRTPTVIPQSERVTV